MASAASAELLPVTALEVSYGGALMPTTYKRLVSKTGVAVSLSPPANTPSYIWLSRAHDAEPITDVTILYDEEPLPEGYKKVARDLSAGGAEKVFLAYRTQPVSGSTMRVVHQLHLVPEGETVDKEGAQRLPRSVLRTGAPMYLVVEYVSLDGSSELSVSAWAEALKVGDLLDCLDKGRRWRAAKVAAVSEDGTKLTIEFKGWSTKYNEELPRGSKRLDKPGSHTAGTDTREDRRQGQAFDVDLEVLASLELRIDDYIAGDFPESERDLFAKGELPSYLETVLSSKYDSEELLDRINSFNQKVLELCAFHLKQLDKTLPPEVRQHLRRLFLDDPHCDYYYQYYGGTRPGTPQAEKAEGWAGKLPPGGASRYFVSNMNHFYNLGGYDAILARTLHFNTVAKAVETGALAATAPEAQIVADAARDDTPMAEIAAFAAILFIPRFCYSREWALRFYQPMRDALLERVLCLSLTQLKKVPREQLDVVRVRFTRLGSEFSARFPDGVAELLSGPERVWTNDTLTSAFERWSLALALRLIRCDSLAVRVKGVTDIRDTAEAVQRGEGAATTSGARRAGGATRWTNDSYYNAAPATWFDAPRLFAWLQDNRVVDVVLGLSTDGGATCPPHEQTISRLQGILEFMMHYESVVNQRRLSLTAFAQALHAAGDEAAASKHLASLPAPVRGVTREQVARLFQLCTVDPSPVFRRAVYDTIMGVAKWADVDMLEYIFSFVLATPVTEFDDSTIAFVKMLTSCALLEVTAIPEREEVARVRAATLVRNRVRENAAAAGASEGAGVDGSGAEAGGADAKAEAAVGAAEDSGLLPSTPTGSTPLPLPATPVPETSNTCTWESRRDWFGLHQLWDYLQQDEGAAAAKSASVRTAAAAAIVELVRMPKRYRQLDLLLTRCIEAVRDGRNVFTNLKLLDALLRALPLMDADTPLYFCAEATLARLQATYNLTHMLVEELAKFQAGVVAAAKEAGRLSAAGMLHPVAPSVAAASHGLLTPATLVPQVEARLSLLLLVLKTGELSLSLPELASVWHTVVDGAVCEEQREAFFSWLWTSRFQAGDEVETTAAKALFNPIQEGLLTTLFCSPTHFSPATCGAQAFRAFELFFRQLNVDAGRMHVDTTGDKMTVADAALTGLETLWQVALHNQNRDVAKSASSMLIDVHANFRPRVTSSAEAARRERATARAHVWESFVRHCMGTIAAQLARTDSATETASPAAAFDTSSAQVINRALRILLRFLAAVESSASGEEEVEDVVLEKDTYVLLLEGDAERSTEERLNSTLAVDAFVRIMEDGRSKLVVCKIMVRPELETVGMLRNRLADALAVSVQHMRLTEVGAQTKLLFAVDDEQLIGKSAARYGVSGAVLSAAEDDTQDCVALTRAQRLDMQYRARRLGEGASQEDVAAELSRRVELQHFEESVVHAPRRLLSVDPHFFDMLFQLLALPQTSIVMDAWSLLQSLPVNDKVVNDIHSLQGYAAPDGSVPSGAGPDWRAVFDPTAPLKLLYSLQIVAKHMKQWEVSTSGTPAAASPAASSPAAAGAEAATPAATADAAARTPAASASAATAAPGAVGDTLSNLAPLDASIPWVRAFVTYGGLAHLHAILMAFDFRQVAQSNALLTECARLLLRIYTRFVSGAGETLRNYTLADGSAVFTTTRPQLVTRLLRILSVITSAQRQAAARAKLGQQEEEEEAGLPASDAPAAGGKAASGASSTTAPDDDAKARAILDRFLSGDDDGLGLDAFFNMGDDDFEPLAADSSAAGGSAKGSAARGPTALAHLAHNTLHLMQCSLLGGDEVAVLAPAAATPAAREAPPAPAAARVLHADALAAFLAVPNVDRVLTLALLTPADETIRSAVASRLLALCEAANVAGGADGSAATLTPFLVARFEAHVESAYAYPHTCGEFFKLLLALQGLRAAPSASSGAQGTSARDTLRDMARLLAQHPVVETGSTDYHIVDNVLRGLLGVLTGLLQRNAELKAYAGAELDLVTEVFDRCLFALPVEDAAAHDAVAQSVESVLGGRLPRCKLRESRKAAFDLLLELARGCASNASLICSKLLPQHDAEASAAAVAASGVLSAAAAAAKAAATEDDDDTKGVAGRGKYGSLSSSDVVTTNLKEKEAAASGGGNMSGRSKNLAAPRSSTGYVGLRNLGCICYMNSTMQQFFMNEAFRRGVLSWKESSTTAAERADSLLYQMQTQFAHLQESDKQYYNPRGLCYAIKDWDGNPTDLFEQKDVPEFLTKLFSDMETQCQGSSLASLPKDVYGGISISEVFADDPRGGQRQRLYKTRAEEFYFLQVQVKGHASLEDALSAYVAGDVLDYKWELPADAAAEAGAATPAPAAGGVGGDVEADATGAASVSPEAAAAFAAAAAGKEISLKTTRRVSLRQLGDHLMVHLNRFEFDYDSMQQAKLNDHFSFPRHLNMWPYTVHGRTDSVAAGTDDVLGAEAYQYELVGVVIHMGTAVGGHYYSYIRERDEAGAGSRWFEFNDSLVSPWEGSDAAFERDCFGGVETYTTGGTKHMSYAGGVARQYTTPVYKSERARVANAFCLFYERVKPKAAPVAAPAPAASLPVATPALSTFASTGSESGSGSTSDGLPANPRAAFVAEMQAVLGAAGSGPHKQLRLPVPAELANAIRAENFEFWRLRTIYELEYFDFMLALVQGIAADVAAGGEAARVVYPAEEVTTTDAAMRLGGFTMPVIRLAVAFMLNTLTDSTQKATIPAWLAAVRTLLQANAVASVWLLQRQLQDVNEFVRQLLADRSAGGDSMRTVLAALLEEAVCITWPLEAAAGAASRGVARRFVQLLLAQLPTLNVHWRRFGPYFGLLRSLATTVPDVRAAMLEDGLVGKLVDFALCGDSPHPDVIPGVPTRDKRSMGDNYTAPDTEQLFSLLQQLIVSCASLSGATDSPLARPPVRPLSMIDADMLSCRQFFTSIIGQLLRSVTLRTYQPLFTHLLWGCGAATAQPVGEEAAAVAGGASKSLYRPVYNTPGYGASVVLGTIAEVLNTCMVVNEWNEMKLAQRFARLVCDVAGDSPDDSLQMQRIDAVMRGMLAGLKSQSMFFRATEIGIENLTKLAKSRPMVQRWVRENAEQWSWCAQWYAANTVAPVMGRVDAQGRRLNKHTDYSSMAYGGGSVRDACTKFNIDALSKGEPQEFDYYESDDEPTSMVGRRLSITYASSNRTFSGTITGYDTTRNEHMVTFDDGSARGFDLLSFRAQRHRLEPSATRAALMGAEAAAAAAATAAANEAAAAARAVNNAAAPPAPAARPPPNAPANVSTTDAPRRSVPTQVVDSDEEEEEEEEDQASGGKDVAQDGSADDLDDDDEDEDDEDDYDDDAAVARLLRETALEAGVDVHEAGEDGNAVDTQALLDAANEESYDLDEDIERSV